MNEIANLCQVLGADIQKVRQGIGTDRRIGPSFLFAGLGYGGSCFPKDVKSLIDMGRRHGLGMQMVSAVHQVNERQKSIILDRIVDFFSSPRVAEVEVAKRQSPGNRSKRLEKVRQPGRSNRVASGQRRVARAHCLKGRTFAVWGLSFKPQTDDMREAPSVAIIHGLLKLGARVRAYDPEAAKAARAVFGAQIEYCRNHYGALKGADALILLTEWNVFRNPDFLRVKKLLRLPVIFDGRNQYDPSELRELGFTSFSIGRPDAG
jgi:UDPglucose 6-dehydrogenase